MLKSTANMRKMVAVTFIVPPNSLFDTYTIMIRNSHCACTVWISFVGGAMPTAVR